MHEHGWYVAMQAYLLSDLWWSRQAPYVHMHTLIFYSMRLEAPACWLQALVNMMLPWHHASTATQAECRYSTMVP